MLYFTHCFTLHKKEFITFAFNRANNNNNNIFKLVVIQKYMI